MIDDCFIHDKDRLRHDDAIEILKSRLSPICKTETTRLEHAASKILSSSITSNYNIPSFNNAAVDGYAFAHGDMDNNNGEFTVSEIITAGDSRDIALQAGNAARIFTGARTPENADSVVMQEDCETKTEGERKLVRVPLQLKKGANLRLAGEDVKVGETIATKGQLLRPQDVAAIASCGVGQISTFMPLKIALVSTGNEIIRPGDALKPGQVYDANHFMLSSLLGKLPVEVTDLGILPDERSIVEDVLNDASKKYDIVLTSGGASRGSEDYVTKLLQENGKCHMWQLAIKPGRPMCFGQLNETMFFGLPGNPVASFVCFLLYVRPALLRLGGADWHEPRRYQLPSGFGLSSKKPDRREYWRGYIKEDINGESQLYKFERDGSGLISGLQKAQGLIEIDEEVTSFNQGEMLNFIPFAEFGIN